MFVFESPGRVAFSVFGLDIMWYGVLIAAGILLAFLIVYKRAPRYHGISEDRVFNWLILIIIVALVGTRLYYVAFEWGYYSQHPLEIFDVRAGGLAIHGGLIAGCLITALLCKLYHEHFLNFVDLCFTAIPLGQAIGRWGNFFNSEAHGTPTNLPWGVIVDGQAVHPTFLYESIWCLILFFILLRVDNRRKFHGQTFFLYCILYSVERFFVEGLRTDSLWVQLPWGEFRQAQVLSICAIVVAGILYVVFYRKAKAAGFPPVNSVYAAPVKEAGSEGAILSDRGDDHGDGFYGRYDAYDDEDDEEDDES